MYTAALWHTCVSRFGTRRTRGRGAPSIVPLITQVRGHQPFPVCVSLLICWCLQCVCSRFLPGERMAECLGVFSPGSNEQLWLIAVVESVRPLQGKRWSVALSVTGKLQGHRGPETATDKWHMETRQRRTVGKQTDSEPLLLCFYMFSILNKIKQAYSNVVNHLWSCSDRHSRFKIKNF